MFDKLLLHHKYKTTAYKKNYKKLITITLHVLWLGMYDVV